MNSVDNTYLVKWPFVTKKLTKIWEWFTKVPFKMVSLETKNKVDQIINNELFDFTDEEKEIIDNIMSNLVFKIDDQIKLEKPINTIKEFPLFILTYNKLDEKLKNYFFDTYKDLVIKNANFKIKRALSNPLSSWWFDEIWIKKEISNILSVESNFDFNVFESDIVDKILKF